MSDPTVSMPGPIAHVQPGMRVTDDTGREVGTVELVKMGDPEAVTTQGQRADEGQGPWGWAVRALGEDEPDVPGPLAARLLRAGYLKVDTGGLFDRDVYLPADEVASVTDGEVRLAISRDRLIEES